MIALLGLASKAQDNATHVVVDFEHETANRL
jgi:hypothetical protein